MRNRILGTHRYVDHESSFKYLCPMGPAWQGLVGAIIGGLVSLIGTLITSQLQWRQERARWNEQRERDMIQWNQQKQSEATQQEGERWRDERAWQRNQYDEQFRWFREQKLKGYLEATSHLGSASELASSAPIAKGEERPYAREDEMAIVRELRNGYRWLQLIKALCGKDVVTKVDDLGRELYFTMQVVDYEGIRPGGMVRRPSTKTLDSWILSEIIDGMAVRLSEVSRTDMGSNFFDLKTSRGDG